MTAGYFWRGRVVVCDVIILVKKVRGPPFISLWIFQMFVIPVIRYIVLFFLLGLFWAFGD